MLTSGVSAHLIRSHAKRNFSSGEKKTAIKKSFYWGDFLKIPEEMYPVYDTRPFHRSSRGCTTRRTQRCST